MNKRSITRYMFTVWGLRAQTPTNSIFVHQQWLRCSTRLCISFLGGFMNLLLLLSQLLPLSFMFYFLVFLISLIFFFFDLSTEARILKAKCLKALKAIESVVWSCQPSKYIQWQQKCLLMEREELVEYSELANSYNNFIYWHFPGFHLSSSPSFLTLPLQPLFGSFMSCTTAPKRVWIT